MTQDPLSEAMRRVMTQALSRFQYRHADSQELKQAAVALTIVDAGNGAGVDGLGITPGASVAPALLLTRRAATLRAHAGQWALPGGRLDPGETAEQAALRELEEEVAVSLDSGAVMGRLDDFVTRSGFVMSPIVVWGGSVASMRPNPDEVASIHRIPLAELDRHDAPILSDSPHGEHPVLRMPIGNDSIAAPTAAILYQFREVVLRGLSTRVAHFEQPDFAWK